MREVEVTEFEKSIAGLKKLTFRAFYGKTQGKLTVRPVFSRSTGRLLGVPLYSEEQKRTTVKVIDTTTERIIEDGTEIDLDDPYDRIDMEWMKHCPELRGSLEECFSSKQALFYVENLTKDTEKRIQDRSYKVKAFKYLETANLSKLHDVCRLMGTDTSSFSKLELEDYLGEMADSNPRKLVEIFEDKLMKIKLFLFGLVDKKIVRVDQDGVYRWGSYILGTTEKSALDWLQISDNAGHVRRLHLELYPAPVIADSEPELAGYEAPLPEGELEEAQLKDRYREVFGKSPGSMNTENIRKRLREKETEEAEM